MNASQGPVPGAGTPGSDERLPRPDGVLTREFPIGRGLGSAPAGLQTRRFRRSVGGSADHDAGPRPRPGDEVGRQACAGSGPWPGPPPPASGHDAWRWRNPGVRVAGSGVAGSHRAVVSRGTGRRARNRRSRPGAGVLGAWPGRWAGVVSRLDAPPGLLPVEPGWECPDRAPSGVLPSRAACARKRHGAGTSWPPCWWPGDRVVDGLESGSRVLAGAPRMVWRPWDGDLADRVGPWVGMRGGAVAGPGRCRVGHARTVNVIGPIGAFPWGLRFGGAQDASVAPGWGQCARGRRRRSCWPRRRPWRERETSVSVPARDAPRRWRDGPRAASSEIGGPAPGTGRQEGRTQGPLQAADGSAGLWRIRLW